MYLVFEHVKFMSFHLCEMIVLIIRLIYLRIIFEQEAFAEASRFRLRMQAATLWYVQVKLGGNGRMQEEL